MSPLSQLIITNLKSHIWTEFRSLKIPIEVLNFSVTVCGDEAFKAVTKGDCHHEALTYRVTVCGGDEAFKAITVTAVMKP